MGFATLERTKIMLNIGAGDTSRDAELQVYVDNVNAELLDLFGLEDVDPRTYQDTLDVEEWGQNWVRTVSYPIQAIESVVNAEDGSEYAGVYHRPLGRLILKSGHFKCGRQTVTATYVAGYPAGSQARVALGHAADQAAVLAANTTTLTGLVEEQIGKYRIRLASGPGGAGGSAVLGADGMPASWIRVIQRYVRATPHSS